MSEWASKAPEAGREQKHPPTSSFSGHAGLVGSHAPLLALSKTGFGTKSLMSASIHFLCQISICSIHSSRCPFTNTVRYMQLQTTQQPLQSTQKQHQHDSFAFKSKWIMDFAFKNKLAAQSDENVSSAPIQNVCNKQGKANLFLNWCYFVKPVKTSETKWFLQFIETSPHQIALSWSISYI